MTSKIFTNTSDTMVKPQMKLYTKLYIVNLLAGIVNINISSDGSIQKCTFWSMYSLSVFALNLKLLF